MAVSIPVRLGVLDPTGETYSVVMRCELGVALRRLSPTEDPLSDPACDMVIVACYGNIDWTLVGRSAVRLPTVVIANPANERDPYRALDTGAFGLVSGTLPQETIGRALAGALRGEPAFARRVFAELVRRRSQSTSTRVLTLTQRQREVAELIASGAADKEIAQALGIATTTAQKHVTHLLKRLDVPNRAAAAAIIAASSVRA